MSFSELIEEIQKLRLFRLNYAEYWVTNRNFNISAYVISSIVLGIALVISVGVNLYQWRARGISKTGEKYSTQELQVKAQQIEGGL